MDLFGLSPLFVRKFLSLCRMNINNVERYNEMHTNLYLTFGENKHATVTLADKLIVTDIDVSRSGT